MGGVRWRGGDWISRASGPPLTHKHGHGTRRIREPRGSGSVSSSEAIKKEKGGCVSERVGMNE